MPQKLSPDYIRGLIDGEGCFTFFTNLKLGIKMPAFVLRMHARDKELIESVKYSLGLRNKIYEYHYPYDYPAKRNRVNRGPQAVLIVREMDQLKNIIVPFFYKRLYGHKGKQFLEWVEKIGSDSEVPERFKFIHKLYKIGYYEKNSKKFD